MKQEIVYLHLKEHKLFSNLSKENIYAILEEITIKRKRRNDILDFKNDKSNLLGFILKGKMKVLQLNEAGRENTKELIREGGYFGDLSNEEKRSYDYGMVISDELVYFTLSSQRFEDLMLEIPQLAINFSKALNLKLNRMESRYASLVSDDVRTRLVDFFRTWAIEEGHREGSEIKLKNYLTHNDIANLISTCRQTVTSILNKLKTEGNIQYSRSQIIIPDLEQLTQQ